MLQTDRRPIEASHGAESLRRLRWSLRMAMVRGRLDIHHPRRKSIQAALNQHFSHRNPRAIERRYREHQRRRRPINRWVQQGIPHAERVVEIEGLHHLKAALSAGAGAILASAHFGHGRLIKPVLGVHGWPTLLVGALGRSDKWPPIASEDLPVSLNLRPHFAALRENATLIMVVDGRVATSSIRVSVRGIGINFAPGTMRIASATGAPVLPTFVIDEGTLGDPLALRLVIHAPLALQNTGDSAADLLENLKRFAAVYADELERHPHNLNWGFVQPESGELTPPGAFSPRARY